MVAQNAEAQHPLMHSSFMPQEEMLEIGKKQKKLLIGIPKENQKIEKRVGLTPEAVEILVNNGHDVIIESGAGEGVRYSDTHYSERGAFIVDSVNKVFNCDVIIRSAPFQPEEIEHLKGHQLIITPLQLMQRTPDYFRKLMDRKITAIAHEFIKNEQGGYPVRQAMNAINGSSSIMIASELMANTTGGKGVMLGGIAGITPTEVVILGAGIAAEHAIRAAIGLGAFVRVFDTSPERLENIQRSVGQPLYTSIFHPKVFNKCLLSADVLIGAIEHPKCDLPCMITEEMVMTMKKASVIIDLNLDEGGCIETSECRTLIDPVYVKHDVIHYTVTNLPSRVARTASIALSNIIGPILLEAGDAGGIKQYLKRDAGVRHGVYLYNGILTNEIIGSRYQITWKDINLLMAAF